MDEIDGRLVGGLVVLAAVADARSFGKAAERLGMTQSGVSKAIAKLESRLGARLIHRTSRAVELTDEGRALYERVVQHLAGIGEAAAETSKSRDAVRGRLRINVDPLFSRVVLSPKLSDFLLQNSQMELRIETRDRIGDLVRTASISRSASASQHHRRSSPAAFSTPVFLPWLRRSTSSARKTRSSARLGERHSPMHSRRRHFNRAPFRLGVPPREGIDFGRGQWAADCNGFRNQAGACLAGFRVIHQVEIAIDRGRDGLIWSIKVSVRGNAKNARSTGSNQRSRLTKVADWRRGTLPPACHLLDD